MAPNLLDYITREKKGAMESIDILMMNCDLFKKMKELAERQEMVLNDDRIDEFNDLLTQREAIKNEVTANSRQYLSWTKNISRKKEHPGTKSLSAEISAIIRSIQETDKRIEVSIVARKTALHDEIKNLRKGQNAVKRYGGTPNKISRFFDKNS
jgi:hypothetical protein